MKIARVTLDDLRLILTKWNDESISLACKRIADHELDNNDKTTAYFNAVKDTNAAMLNAINFAARDD